MQDYVAVFPVFRQSESAPVASYGIVGMRYIRRIDRERIFCVGVDRGSVALHLQVRRHRYFAPSAGVICRILETCRSGVGSRRIVEFPCAVQAHEIRRFVAFAGKCGFFRMVGVYVCACLKAAYAENTRIFYFGILPVGSDVCRQ